MVSKPPQIPTSAAAFCYIHLLLFLALLFTFACMKGLVCSKSGVPRGPGAFSTPEITEVVT